MRTHRFILERDLRWYRERLERFGLSAELIAAAIGITGDEAQAMLDGRIKPSLPFRVFMCLFGSAGADARKAMQRAIRDFAEVKRETVWRPIPGFERYEASNFGQIRRASNIKGVPLGVVLKPYGTISGHLKVSIYDNAGKQKRIGVHRAVAITFIGAVPADRPLVCHRNGDPADNQPSNLYYGTQAENVADMKRHRATKLRRMRGLSNDGKDFERKAMC
jgi:hypothetical protein